MLSTFPSLLSWSQFSPFLIRITLGTILIFWAYRVLADKSIDSQNKIIGIIEAISGIMLVIGLWSQIAALIVTVDLVIRLVGKIRNKAFLTDGVNYYLVLLVMALSLMVTGAGFWAFDLPL